MNENPSIKQPIQLKGYNGVVSVDVIEKTLVMTKEFIYKHSEYGPSLFANNGNEDAIDREKLLEQRNMMSANQNKESNVKSIKINIPGK